MQKALLLFFLLHPVVPMEAQGLESLSSSSLQKYIGYYHVGVKPERPFFYARAFIRNGNLFLICDGDKGNELVWKEGQRFSLKGDTAKRYQVSFTQRAGLITGFKVDRPRIDWPTDLYGYRVEPWNHYGIDTEQALQGSYASPHFTFYFSQKDSAIITPLADHLEKTYVEKLHWFNLDRLPPIAIRIYPDMDTYHNAVLTPQAPDWQMGRAWTMDEIRIVSPTEARKEMGQAFTFEQAVEHELVHCIHWNLITDTRNTPGWLWEGIAMFQGCCAWQNLQDLPYLRSKSYPSLKDLERDGSAELKYQLGYYLVEFIVRTWGREKLLELIRSKGNLSATLHLTRKQFEKQFYASLTDRLKR